MIFGGAIDDAFRNMTGMPSRLSTFDIRLLPYREIVECITSLKDNVIKYFEESHYSDWCINQLNKELLHAQVINGVLSVEEYDRQHCILFQKDDEIISNFIENSSEYFVVGYKSRLNTIKKRNKHDRYIDSMDFDSWNGMLAALELSKIIISTTENSDEYVDAKKIAEIRDRYLRARHEKRIRRGR